jgi:DNA-binding transcriptional LysR family regulator
MHVKSLKVFCDVVGRRSFSRGARENGVSQSAASQIVHQLEDNLGVKLIDRSKRPFVLTAEGEVYYDGCRKLVQRYYALQEEVRSLHEQMGGRVHVASIYSVGLSYGKQLIDGFAARHPNTVVEIEYHHPDKVYALVAEDQAEIGLVSYARATRSIKAIEGCVEPMLLVCSPSHRLADRTASREDLAGLKVIGFDRALRIRRNVDRQLADQGIEVRVDVAFDNIDTIKRAIVVNAGASFLPEPSVRGELQAGELVAVPVEGLSLVRPLGIIHRRGVELGKTARRFIEYLTESWVGVRAECGRDDGQECPSYGREQT